MFVCVCVCVGVGSLCYVLHDFFYFSSSSLSSFLLLYPTHSWYTTFAHKAPRLISYLCLGICIVPTDLFSMFYRLNFGLYGQRLYNDSNFMICEQLVCARQRRFIRNVELDGRRSAILFLVTQSGNQREECRIGFLSYSSTSKIEATCFETSVDFQRTALRSYPRSELFRITCNLRQKEPGGARTRNQAIGIARWGYLLCRASACLSASHLHLHVCTMDIGTM
jgi:hypothetical protein